eukprot:6492713-Amphidinium_carterae.2
MPEGLKLHVHNDSASGVAMASKLGMSKKSKHIDIEIRYLDLQGLVESGVRGHFSKVGLEEIGVDQVSIQHLRIKLSATNSISPTPDLDVRTPESRKTHQDD